ncbi:MULTISPECIES: hypothetical protein [unclassified Thermosynechococcus]|uniref:hypothetical protein n=1 Tax=unclassified Thermosynechococcus TaxID=2622553 RepID=UPI00122DED6B|nr:MULTISPECIES: hypothetical protein [unclassified Thermosynechococcus]MDR5638792.1 hypothetical protein [Thermosynechococcus sp. PP42]MDR7897886.1 hypothetical protein [Thermosynechococcus sp. JY1332]MDR7905285.1 hypothetical protein [Thermosynechococcus sp. JY1334]MDR7922790.1 hypothetical protein [Thermosynechococcus sp. HY213]MDR7993110.1 hypothetical protein [Thermosynechococcus sp. TG252]
MFDPPIVLLLAGIFMGLTSGKAFEATLKQSVQEWNRSRSTRVLSQLRGPQLQLPYLGISIGIWLFLMAGLWTYGFGAGLSMVIAFVLTIATALLVWYQLGKVLTILSTGGSRALDLDALEAKE